MEFFNKFIELIVEIFSYLLWGSIVITVVMASYYGWLFEYPTIQIIWSVVFAVLSGLSYFALWKKGFKWMWHLTKSWLIVAGTGTVLYVVTKISDIFFWSKISASMLLWGALSAALMYSNTKFKQTL